MQIETFYTLNRNEIENLLKPRLTCQLSHGSDFNKMKVKKALTNNFDAYELEVIEKIKRISYKWNINTGTPESYKISAGDYAIWKKFINFLCAYCTAYGKGDEDFMK